MFTTLCAALGGVLLSAAAANLLWMASRVYPRPPGGLWQAVRDRAAVLPWLRPRPQSASRPPRR